MVSQPLRPLARMAPEWLWFGQHQRIRIIICVHCDCCIDPYLECRWGILILVFTVCWSRFSTASFLSAQIDLNVYHYTLCKLIRKVPSMNVSIDTSIDREVKPDWPCYQADFTNITIAYHNSPVFINLQQATRFPVMLTIDVRNIKQSFAVLFNDT